MSTTTFVLLALLGAGVGVFGTLVGAGGGFIVTPVLLLLYPQDSPATITAISLVVVFFNALSGSLAYARQRRIDYRSGVAFAAATLPGSVAGVIVVGLAPRRLFDAIMGVLLTAVAIWLAAGARTPPRAPDPRGSARHLVARDGTEYRYTVRLRRGVAYSVVVGFVSSFLGIGGGVLHVPLLIRALGFPVHVATATSHFVLANMSFVATITHVVNGSFAGGVGVRRAIALSLGVVAGAQLGAWASRRVRGPVIQWLLVLGLIGLAVRLLIGAA